MNSLLIKVTRGRLRSDLCKDLPATQDALAPALCYGLLLLLAHGILLLVVPLGKNLHGRLTWSPQASQAMQGKTITPDRVAEVESQL